MKTAAKTIATLILLSALAATSKAQGLLEPDKTFQYAQKDTCALFMDVYYPADGSETRYGDQTKPTILFVFGGGFKMGNRAEAGYNRWFRLLTDNGYTVASIDYRLGLKNSTKVGLGQAAEIHKAIELAVEDLFSATRFIIDNSEEVDIDASDIVISGSSAGAITVLQAEWELCNRSGSASILPEDFRYAGVMSFSGAIFSKDWGIRYKREPAPTLMFHGTDDKIVNYRKIQVLNLSFEGSGSLSKRFRRQGYDFSIYRFDGNGHEIAGAMAGTVPEQLRFLESDVMGKQRRNVDATVNDPSLKKFSLSRKKMYKGEL